MEMPDVSPIHILEAAQRINGLVSRTPVERSAPLSSLIGTDVYLKLECVQTTGSFKLRGASNALRQALETAKAPLRIVACSAGNHALGVAYAAAILGVDATLVLPGNASPAKIAGLRRYPVQLVLQGASYDDAEAEALRIARDEERRFVSPYNDPAVMFGQGTLAVELLEQLPESDVVLVPVGGGGLLSGMLLWIKAINPAIKVIGIQPEVSAVMTASVQAGQIVTLPDLPSLADGLAGSVEADTITLPITRRYVDEMIVVSEASIAAAMRWLLDEHHLLVEGSGAVSVAALLNGQIKELAGRRVVAVLTGRNVATNVIREILTDH